MIGNKIAELRKYKGYTQKEVAEKLNISRTGYANWEQGHTEPSSCDMRKICVLYDITADELLEIESAEERKRIKLNTKGD